MKKFLICTTKGDYMPEYVTMHGDEEFITTNESDALQFNTRQDAENAMSNLKDDYDFLEVVELEID